MCVERLDYVPVKALLECNSRKGERTNNWRRLAPLCRLFPQTGAKSQAACSLIVLSNLRPRKAVSEELLLPVCAETLISSFLAACSPQLPSQRNPIQYRSLALRTGSQVSAKEVTPRLAAFCISMRIHGQIQLKGDTEAYCVVFQHAYVPKAA